jgi:hypothetical protein
VSVCGIASIEARLFESSWTHCQMLRVIGKPNNLISMFSILVAETEPRKH